MRVTPHSQNKHKPRSTHRRLRPVARTVVHLTAVCVFAAALVVLSDLPAASASASAAEPDQVVAIADSVDEVLGNIRDWLMSVLAALATVFLTIGGVIYMMAGGDPGQVERAKTAFKAAGTGYALAALAPLVVQVLEGIVGA